MMREETILRIKPVLEEALARSGYCLVDARFFRRQGELVFELLVDRAEGGIALEECARLNRELGGLIEQGAFISESYTLEIASPGLDRPLLTPQDFKRVAGRQVAVFLKEAAEGKLEHHGVVEASDEASVTIRTKDKTIQIPLEKINKAKQVIG